MYLEFYNQKVKTSTAYEKHCKLNNQVFKKMLVSKTSII